MGAAITIHSHSRHRSRIAQLGFTNSNSNSLMRLNFHNKKNPANPCIVGLTLAVNQYASTSLHPERSEGSVAMGVEMLRGVYTERSACCMDYPHRSPRRVSTS